MSKIYCLYCDRLTQNSGGVCQKCRNKRKALCVRCKIYYAKRKCHGYCFACFGKDQLPVMLPVNICKCGQMMKTTCVKCTTKYGSRIFGSANPRLCACCLVPIKTKCLSCSKKKTIVTQEEIVFTQEEIDAFDVIY